MRKINQYIIFTVFGAILMLLSCSRDRLSPVSVVDTPVDKPPEVKDNSDLFLDAVDIKAIKELQKPKLIKRPTSADMANEFTGNSTFFSIGGNKLLSLDGMEMPFPYELVFEEYLTKRDYVVNDLPTVSNGRILESGGSFFVVANKDGNQLRPNPAKYPTLIFRNKKSYNGMTLWYGQRNATTMQFNWLPGTGSDFLDFTNRNNPNAALFEFGAFPAQFGYANIDKIAQFKDQNVSLTFKSTLIQNPKKYLVYVIFKDRFIVLNPANNMQDKLPSNEAMYIMAVAQDKNDKIYLSLQEIAPSESLTVSLNFKPSTKPEIETLLKALN